MQSEEGQLGFLPSRDGADLVMMCSTPIFRNFHEVYRISYLDLVIHLNGQAITTDLQIRIPARLISKGSS